MPPGSTNLARPKPESLHYIDRVVRQWIDIHVLSWSCIRQSHDRPIDIQATMSPQSRIPLTIITGFAGSAILQAKALWTGGCRALAEGRTLTHLLPRGDTANSRCVEDSHSPGYASRGFKSHTRIVWRSASELTQDDRLPVRQRRATTSPQDTQISPPRSSMPP